MTVLPSPSVGTKALLSFENVYCQTHVQVVSMKSLADEWCRCVDDMSTAVAESCESSQLWFTHSKALDALDMR